MIDFGKVVIFASQPEDGHMRTACGGSLPRARQRGSCFERRIQRPAEKSNLLPGHHRSGALPESCKRRSGGLRWRWVLLRKEPHQLRPVRGNSRARLPTHAGRKRSEKWPHSRVSGAEVLKYPAEARRNGNGMTVYSLQLAHLGLMDCINWRNPPWLNLNSALLRMPRQAESMHKGQGNRIWILEWGHKDTDFRDCGGIPCFERGRGSAAAEKPRRTGESSEKSPSGANARVDFKATYGTTRVVPRRF